MSGQRGYGSGDKDETPAVLVVDDEPSIREFLAFILADEGFRVSTARDGRDALDKLADVSPDVVVTDLMMPRMDGYELIARLRAACAGIRAIIAMSAVSTAGEHPPAADLFIQKPFEVEEILASVHSLLSSLVCARSD